MNLENHTPYQVCTTISLDQSGRETLFVLVKATYECDDHGQLSPALSDPEPVRLCDTFEGTPPYAWIRESGDLALDRPGVDVALHGFAVPVKEGGNSGRVSLQIGTLHKEIAVHGERHWQGMAGIYRPSRAQPFECIPLDWTHAFGGADTSHSDEKHHAYEARNPAGRGFLAKKTRLAVAGHPLPHLETVGRGMRTPFARPEPAGFGYLGPAWPQRARFAGGEDGDPPVPAPFLPADYDSRFANSVAQDQVLAEPPAAGTAVTVGGMCPQGPWTFALPETALALSVSERGGGAQQEPTVERVCIDAEARRISLLWCGRFHCYNNPADLGAVRVEDHALTQAAH